MKKLAWTALCSVLFLSFACGDDDGDNGNDSDAGSRPDSGPDDRPDAMPAFGTCGMVIDPTASIPLGSPSSLAGVPVIFSNADGSWLGTEYTDTKGMASRDDCAPGTVMTFFLEDYGPEGGIFTYAGANPGDTFYYRASPPYEEPPYPYANVNVTTSQDFSALTDVDTVTAQLGCAGLGGAPTGYFLFNDVAPCAPGADDSALDVIAWVQGDGGGIDGVTGYAFAKGVPFTKGTSVTPADNVVALGPWIPGNLDNAGLVKNLPPSSDYACWSGYSLVDGFGQAGWGDCSGWGLGAPPAVLTRGYRGLPEGYGERSIFRASSWGPLGNGYYMGFEIQEETAFARTTTSDFSDRLPGVPGVVVSGVGSEQPTVTWITEDVAQGDLAVIEIRLVPYYYGYPDYSSVHWFLVTPNVADGSFTLPVLPPELQEIFQDPYLVPRGNFACINDLGSAGYRDLVAHPGFDPADACWSPLDFMGPSTGADRRVRTAGWGYD